MSFIESAKLTLISGIIENLVGQFEHGLRSIHDSKELRQSWEYFILLELIIQYFNLFPLLVLELFSIEGIPDWNYGCFHESIVAANGDDWSDHQHGGIRYFLVPSSLIDAGFGDFCVFHEHIPSRNPIFIESYIAIVFIVVAIFGSDIPDFNPRKWFMIFISDGHKERMKPILFIFYQ